MHTRLPLVCLALAASLGISRGQFSGAHGDGFASATLSGTGLDPLQPPPAWVAATAAGGGGDGFASMRVLGTGLDPLQPPPAWVAATAAGGIGDGFSSDGLLRVGLDGNELLFVIRVGQGAGGNNDGTSWQNARNDLQAAIDAAEPGDTIWVSAGTYRPNGGNPADMSRAQSFRMKNGVTVYGGFAGTETALEDRDPAANPTILSGDLAGNDADAEGDGYPDAATMGDNAYNVIRNPSSLGLDRSAVLDGFIITGGNAVGDGTERGGGIHNDNASPTLRRCVITGNRAGGFGGAGVWNLSGSPLFLDCEITWNYTASNIGGGIYNYQSSATYSGCTVASNRAPNGGGMGNVLGVCDITNCTFVANRATSYGGALYNSSSVSGNISHCTLWRNTAPTGGGAYNTSSGNPDFTNMIFWENAGGEIVNNGASSSPEVNNCIILGGYAGGTNVSTDDPLLLPFGNYGGATRTTPLSPGSPAINAGLAGTPLLPTDQRGFPRDASPDIGAAEAQTAASLLVDISAAALPEGAGNAATTLTVTRTGSTAAALVVGLVSGDTGEVTVPQTLTIPAGQASAAVGVNVLDDAVIDGVQHVTVAAWAPYMLEGHDVLDVLDDDGTYVAPGTVSGTWPTSALPYYVAGDITIPAGQTLTIEQANTVLFAKGARLTVGGTLMVSGVEGSPVLFTSSSATPAPGDWGGVLFSSAGGEMHWATVQFATTGIACSKSSPLLDHLVVRNHSGTGISVSASASGCNGGYAGPTITDSEVYGNGGTGVSYSGSGSSFSGCSLPKTGAVAGTLSRCAIHHNAVGISISAYDGYFANGSASPTIDHCHIYGNAGSGITTAGDDSVSPKILHCLVRANGGTGIRFNALYGSTSVRNCILTENAEGLSAGANASFVFRNNDVWSNTTANFGVGLGTVGVMTHLNPLGAVSDANFNISQDPLFVDADGLDNDGATVSDNDYHLSAASPCIDAGYSADPYDAEPEDNGNLPNIGIFGNTAEAATSIPGRPLFTAVPSDGPGRYLLPIQFDFGSDAEGLGGTYAILQSDAGVTGASIHVSTGVFSWTPQIADSGKTRRFFVGITLAGLTRVTGWAITVIPDADGDGMTDQWESAYGLDPLVAGGSGDGDGDGLTDLLEFAFNLDPTRSDRSMLVPGSGTFGLPVISLDGSGPSQVVRFEFLRRKGMPITYTPQRSTTLAADSWSTLVGTTTVVSIDAEWERVTISQPLGPSTPATALFRVRVVPP